MNYVTCIKCGKTVSDAAYCQSCGFALKKWCSQCEKWQEATMQQAELDDNVLISEWQEEVMHCQDCGGKLQAKPAPHE